MNTLSSSKADHHQAQLEPESPISTSKKASSSADHHQDFNNQKNLQLQRQQLQQEMASDHTSRTGPSSQIHNSTLTKPPQEKVRFLKLSAVLYTV